LEVAEEMIMEAGSLVEVSINGRQHYGVVRWSGRPSKSSSKSQQILVGVELVMFLIKIELQYFVKMNYF